MPFKLLLICFILFSCSSSRMMETNLYFGQSKPGGGSVSEKEWNSFKENYISKVFKEGSTVINVTGNWNDPDSHKLITSLLTWSFISTKKHLLFPNRSIA